MGADGGAASASASAPAADGSSPGAGRMSFPAIDLLRAFAALIVLAYHVIAIGEWASFPISGPALLVRVGWMGVDLFFVISGFVIGLSALQGVARDGPAFRTAFARHRIARIVPLYVLTCVAFLAFADRSLLTLPWKPLFVHLGAHAGFIHNLNPSTHGSIDGPNWSVALEMQFYAAMLLAAPWLARSRAIVVLPLLVLVSWAWRALVAWQVGVGVDHAHLLHVYSSQLPGTVDGFGFGIAMAIGVAGARKTAAAQLLAVRWRNFALWSAAFAVIGCAAWVTFWQHAAYWDDFVMIAFWRTLLAAAFACLVAAAVTLPAARTPVLRPLRYLGEISYGLYLWHVPVLLVLMKSTPWREAQLLGAVLCATIALAALSWHLLERPVIRRLRR